MFVCLFVSITIWNHSPHLFPIFMDLDRGDTEQTGGLFNSKEGSSSMSDTSWIPQRYMQGYVVDP